MPEDGSTFLPGNFSIPLKESKTHSKNKVKLQGGKSASPGKQAFIKKSLLQARCTATKKMYTEHFLDGWGFPKRRSGSPSSG
jgi:hypothetical protein